MHTVRVGLEMGSIGLICVLEEIVSWGLKRTMLLILKKKINILCVIQKGHWSNFDPPYSFFASALNLTTKWISPPIALTKEDASVSAPSGKMSGGSAICNANCQALASKIDVPVRMYLVAGLELSGSDTALFPASSACQG